MISHSISRPTAVSNISLREPRNAEARSAPAALAPAAASLVTSCGTAKAMLAGAFSMSPSSALRCRATEPAKGKWRATNASTRDRRLAK